MLYISGIYRSSHQKCSGKKGVLTNLQENLQENICARVSFLIKLQDRGQRPATLLKKRLWHRCFPVNLQILYEQLFYGTPLVDCFWI